MRSYSSRNQWVLRITLILAGYSSLLLSGGGCAKTGAYLKQREFLDAISHNVEIAKTQIKEGKVDAAIGRLSEVQAAIGPVSTLAPKTEGEASAMLQMGAVAAAQERETHPAPVPAPAAPPEKKSWFGKIGWGSIAAIAGLAVMGVAASVALGLLVSPKVGIAAAGVTALIVTGMIIVVYWKYMVLAAIVIMVLFGIGLAAGAFKAKKIQESLQDVFGKVVTSVQAGRGALANVSDDTLKTFDQTVELSTDAKVKQAVKKVKEKNGIQSVSVLRGNRRSK